jgi:hypothetical protein
VSGGLFSTPRPEPSHLLPAAGSALVIALALPIVVISGWSVAGWGLAATLWLAVHGIDLALARMRNGTVAAPAVQVFAVFFKSIGLLVVLFAAVAADRELALTAAATYALAYTFELGLSLVFYFGATPQRTGQP